MFPLQLLALIFISTPTPDLKKRRQGEEEADRQGEADRQVKGRTDRQYELLLKRGDLLEVPRTLFTHFGIYLGGGRVAHFIPDIIPVVSGDQTRIGQMVTNSRLLLGVLAKCGSVRVDSVEDFAYGSEILVNTSDKVCSRPALNGEEVARRAEKLRGHVSYSLLWYNCEHFVMYCRYGTVVSFQTFQFCRAVRSSLLLSRVLQVTAVLGGCLLPYLREVKLPPAPRAGRTAALFSSGWPHKHSDLSE
ncbi:LOW QUALITY PROTEIN: lecithin retinol acyltransferase b, tandem duplicate 2 [Morone saxatilis]|uniref:LOW QUALITY PROTEIN: lecithin retinol acyltransferase b, tandem duplicate 2 n=1 Tax=Morone saxatilis TaxID=34816 RepID=UPI0015E20BA2|nr:LOW QUALITY PROTEIN: lecithin retinol acyltransferase b, tandem duplicate 2 [Morone saxatilis]